MIPIIMLKRQIKTHIEKGWKKAGEKQISIVKRITRGFAQKLNKEG